MYPYGSDESDKLPALRVDSVRWGVGGNARRLRTGHHDEDVGQDKPMSLLHSYSHNTSLLTPHIKQLVNTSWMSCDLTQF